MSSSDSDEDDNVSFIDLLNSVTVAVSSEWRERKKKLDASRSRLKGLTNLGHAKVFRNKKVELFRDEATARLKKWDQALHTEFVVSKTEKVWYTGCLVGIFFLGWLMASYREWVHVVYTVLLGILLPIRFVTYYQRKFHFYLADLCYFVNMLMIIFIWFKPASTTLWISCFSFSFGTLSFAIITWRNSLVLHSIDKTTSTVIHIMPPLLCHTFNHLLTDEYKAERFPATVAVESWDVVPSMIYTTIAYFIWQSLYHIFITWLNQDKIKAGQVTSFEFLRKAYGDTRLGKFVNGLPGFLPVVAFTFIQFGYQFSTMLPCPIWYKYEKLSSVFMVFIFSSAAYNGASYYIDFYGKRFHKELQKVQRELDELQQQLESSPDSSRTSILKSVDSAIDNIQEETQAYEKKDKNRLI